jgi:hypothetical protein
MHYTIALLICLAPTSLSLFDLIANEGKKKQEISVGFIHIQLRI